MYRFKYDEYGNTREILVYGSGSPVSSLSFLNKGTAFTESERQGLGLQALLPPSIRTLADQIENTRAVVEGKSNDIERFSFIRALFDRNVTLAHALLHSDLDRYLGIVYLPTIRQAVQRFSSLYRQASGLHFYPGNIDLAEDILRRYQQRDIRIAVVTDNQGVLGIGDQGAGGIAVCLGKLMLYTQGGGIAPWHCLPVSLDVGTDNQALLADRQYLGWRHPRLTGEEYLSFVGRFVRAFRNVFPNAICQWENFSKQNAFSIRNAFIDEIISFNDNIQGTGTVALAAVLTAMRVKGERLRDQIFLVEGSEACGVGVCELLEDALREEGLSEREACARLFLMDASGQIKRSKDSEFCARRYAKDAAKLAWLKKSTAPDNLELLEKTGATVVISLAPAQATMLTENTVTALLQNTARPVIISFADQHAAETPLIAELHRWTKGQALLAGGTSVTSHAASCQGVAYSQAHTVLAFPGLGLGVLASGAREILPAFFLAAARCLAEQMRPDDLQQGKLLPAIADLEEVSSQVALAVAMSAVRKEVSRPCAFSSFDHHNDEARMQRLICGMRWRPQYLPLVPM